MTLTALVWTYFHMPHDMDSGLPGLSHVRWPVPGLHHLYSHDMDSGLP